MSKIVVVLVALIVVIIAVAPLLTIWALNTLFSTGIEYTFWTWLAALILVGIVGSRAASSSKGK